jgi:hypothetical protein
MIDPSKLKDGFWCSPKTYSKLKPNLDLLESNTPLYGYKVYPHIKMSNDKAALVINGSVREWFDIDWGLH